MKDREVLQRIGELVNATDAKSVVRLLSRWLAECAETIEHIDAKDETCKGHRALAARLACLVGDWPTMNGQDIFVSGDGSTLFVPIPRELAADCGHCDCDYCKAHPDVTPKWDTLALAANPKDRNGEHTWTVHLPDKSGLKLYGWQPAKGKVKR